MLFKCTDLLRSYDLQTAENPRFDAELQQEGVTCAACHVKDGVIYGPYKRTYSMPPILLPMMKNSSPKNSVDNAMKCPVKNFLS